MDISISGAESAQGKRCSAPVRNLLLDHVIHPQSENGMENRSFKGVEKGFSHENRCANPFRSPEMVMQVENAEL
jgi:hypothetical protein